MNHHLSLSRYALAVGAHDDPPRGCSYWARPDVTLVERPVGPPARIGTGVHRLSHATISGVADELADMDPHEAAEARAIFSGPLKGYVEAWRDEPCDHRISELRLRYDATADTVREAERRGEAGYSRPGPAEVTGELDLVRKLGDVVEIEDIKTGQARHVHEEQLLAYGVLAARHYGVARVRVRFLYALKTKLKPTDWAELDGDRLDAEAGRLVKTLRRLPVAEPIDGDWCDFRCPLGKGACPAWVGKQEKELEEAGLFA